MGAPALLRRWTCAFSPQVSLEKEAAGLAGLLPGGERVSAGVWRSRPRAIPGSPHLGLPRSAWQSHLRPQYYQCPGQEGD